MDDAFDRMVLDIRVETEEFARDVATLRATLEESLGAGAAVAARGIETALSRAVRSGKLELEDLGRVAARVLGEVAAAALHLGQGPAGGGLVAGLMSGAVGMPGRATGGPVAPGRAYLVGERGPELFIPTTSGRIDNAAGRGSPVVHLTVNLAGSEALPSPDMLATTGRQLARRLHRSLAALEV
ncbi:MAG: tail tape measure protein [Sphingomonadaceae bacterium]|nr:tail tape measure protein [Sphingomonadaceae bacterium]